MPPNAYFCLNSTMASLKNISDILITGRLYLTPQRYGIFRVEKAFILNKLYAYFLSGGHYPAPCFYKNA